MFFFLVNLITSYVTCNNAECNEQILSATKFKVGDRIAVDAIFSGYTDVGGTEPPAEGETEPDTEPEQEYHQKFTRFYVEVDKLAILQIQDETCEITNWKNSTLQLRVAGKTTNLWAYRPADNEDLVTEYFSAQVEMVKGEVTGVAFDTLFDQNSCKGERLPYRCATKRPISGDCPDDAKLVKVFLAFVGTDSDETPFESRQLLPSTFLKYGMRGVIDDAVDLFNNAKDWVTNIFN